MGKLEILKETEGDPIKNINSLFHDLTKSPEQYLRPQPSKSDLSTILCKKLYDYGQEHDRGGKFNVPDELTTDEMDEEQIWQQLELLTDPLLSDCLKTVSHLLSGDGKKLELKFTDPELDNGREPTDTESNDSSEPDDEQIESDENDSETVRTPDPVKNAKSPIGKRSNVDDSFFKLSEMEAFLDGEDRKEMLDRPKHRQSDSDEEIDYFDENLSDNDSDDENNTNLMYSDFFDGNEDVGDDRDQEPIVDWRNEREMRNKIKLKLRNEDLGLEDSDLDENQSLDDEIDESDRKVKFDLSKNQYHTESDDGTDDLNVENPQPDEELSSFQQQQARLRKRIADMEEDAIGEKTWQLKGEIDSSNRPKNALLEEYLEFDATVRPAPIITEETTLQLEEIIKRRIKDRAWDDVERKFKPIQTPHEFRKRLVLDQAKSKESLAQIYEKDYIAEMDKLSGNVDKSDAPEPQQHQEIRKVMKELFIKLDALSNFYYTPKPVVPNVRIITNVPAIDMEEVAPIAISSAQLLAPEEVKLRPKGDVIGQSERNKTDKLRQRRQKKLKQRRHKVFEEKRDVERAKAGLPVKGKREEKKLLEKVVKNRNVTKMKETADGGPMKSSKAFFSRLQDQVSVQAVKKRKGEDGVVNKETKRYKFKK